MKFGSLFSGIGGIDLGFERAGWQCAWQVESDEHAQKILAKHWPSVERWGRIEHFFPSERYAVDCVAGGFPCKQTSTAAAIHGKRKGLEGADSGLWFEMLRVLRVLRPEWVVVENVAGAATWQDAIKTGLAAAGYQVPDKPACLSAASFGAPHRRRRLFWIADRHGKGLSIPWQTEPPATRSEPRGTANGNTWLSSLARTMRVDDGIPARVDRAERIKRLGNAVVPCVAEYIAKQIERAA